MTIENFNEILLQPVALSDNTGLTLNNDDIEKIYKNFVALYEDWPFVTKLQRDCFELYYNLKLPQHKVAEFMRIKQSTVSEHVKKALDSYTDLVKVIYYCTLWSIQDGN